jgi:colanic acid biosynthesis glycosyl transferase WcaI
LPQPIVFLNRFFFPDESATSQFTSDLAFELVTRGYSVHVVTSRQAYQDPKRQLPRAERVRGVEVRRIRTSRRGRMHVWGLALDYFTFYVSSAWRLWRMLRPGWIVVARTDPPVVSVVAWLVARLRRATLVTWLADLFPEIATELNLPGGRGRLGAVLRWLRNLSLKHAAVNIVLGDSMRRHLVAQGVPAGRIRVIRDWADGSAIRPVAKCENRLAREWGLADKFVVGYSGNMGRAHLFDTVVQAMVALRGRDGLRFLFIGSGVRRGELTRAVERHGLDNVLFCPYQPWERLGESLTVPDVHVVTLNPKLEGLIVPSKFYSAAAAGRPTVYVGDPSGEIPSLLSRYGCGIAVQEGDVRGLVSAIERLAGDPAFYQTMASNAREAFEKHFDRSGAMDAWVELLREICEAPAPA